MAARRRVPFFVQSAARRASPSDVLRLLIVTSSFPGGGGWNLTTPESGLLRTRPETSTLRRMNGSREWLCCQEFVNQDVPSNLVLLGLSNVQWICACACASVLIWEVHP